MKSQIERACKSFRGSTRPENLSIFDSKKQTPGPGSAKRTPGRLNFCYQILNPDLIAGNKNAIIFSLLDAAATENRTAAGSFRLL